MTRTAPALAKAKPVRLPTVADTTLDNGLRVLAVRRPGVPLAEVRLRIPFAAPAKGTPGAADGGLVLGPVLHRLGHRRAPLSADLTMCGGRRGADHRRREQLRLLAEIPRVPVTCVRLGRGGREQASGQLLRDSWQEQLTRAIARS